MKRLIPLLLVFCLLVSACGAKGSILKYDIPAPVASLDPQFVTDTTASMIVSNVFEGLFRQLPSGEVEPCIAEEWTVSPDGLVYTFRLRQGIRWNRSLSETGAWTTNSARWSDPEGTPVTAHDFVFALRRLFDENHMSELAAHFLCIRNAPQILAGEMNSRMLGVRADSDYTLEITLSQPNRQLPELLASSAAMPCNQAFYESTRGRYGLDVDTLMSNGPFYVSIWNNDTAIALRRSEVYREDLPVRALGVNFYFPNSESFDPLARFLNGDTDACEIDYAHLAEMEKAGCSVTSFEDTVWVLALNQDEVGTEGYSFSRAVAHTVDRDRFSDYLTENLRTTSVLVPPAVSSSGESFRAFAGELSPTVYSPFLARQYYAETLEQGEAPNLREILVCDEGNLPLLAGYVQQGLQNNLSLYTTLVRLPRKELLERVAAGDYQAAILPLTVSYSSPEAIFSCFHAESSQNFTGYDSRPFEALLSSAALIPVDQLYSVYKEAEQRLLYDCPVVPLFFETSYYAVAPGVSGIAFSPFLAGMRFQDAVKK